MKAARVPDAFTGTATLLRLAVRRDRAVFSLWLFGLFVYAAGVASTIVGPYAGDAEAREGNAATRAAVPAIRALYGSSSGDSLGALMMAELLVLMSVLAALMSMFTLIRHTRHNEQTGRSEMIGAGVVGRHAGLSAALLVTVGTNFLLSGLITLALVVVNGLPFAGALAASAGFAGVGTVFAGVAAIAAQVSGSGRGANGLSMAALGFAVLLRAAGDALGKVQSGGVEVDLAWPGWLSPLGWVQQMDAFQENSWWVLLLFATLFALLVGAAFLLETRRDVGIGMMPARRGPAVAPQGLLSPLGLAWRLQRGALFGWAAAMVVVGGFIGLLNQDAGELARRDPQAAEVFAQLGGFVGTTMGLLGVISVGYLLQALLRMQSEESEGFLEPVLATATARPRWMLAHITCAVLGTVLILMLMGLSAGLVSGVAAGEMVPQLFTLTRAALVQVPAAVALAGFVIAAFGLLPRWSVAISWGGFAVSVVLVGLAIVVRLGVGLDVPQAILNLSPFTHTTAALAGDATAAPLAVLLGMGLVLSTAGLAAFRHRDLRFQ